VIRYLLKELEKSLSPVYSKRELLAISPTEFQELLKKQLLVYVRPFKMKWKRLDFLAVNMVAI